MQKVVRQKHTDVTSFCMQFEKIGHGLLRKAFRREKECVLAEREEGNKKGLVLENIDNLGEH